MRLFICEKPSQARDIARVLQATRRGDGCLQGQGATVTWCVGHLLETAPPEAYGNYKRWSLEDLPIIPAHHLCPSFAAHHGAGGRHGVVRRRLLYNRS